MKAILFALAIAMAIIVALLAAPLIIPTSAYEHLFVRSMSHHLGCTVTVDKMRVRFLPYLSFTISGVTLTSQEPLFQQRPVATVERITGAFSVVDIIRHRLDTTLTIDGLHINRISTATGNTNLDPVFSKLMAPAGDNPLAGWQIDIDSISISNGSFNDYGPGGQLVSHTLIDRISINNFITGQDLSGSAYMKATMYGASKPNFEISGQFFFDRPSTTFHARECKIDIAGISGTLDASFELAKKPIHFVLHGATPSATLQQLGPLFPSISKGFPAGIFWSGPVALDLYLKGSRHTTGIRLQAEASMSEVKVNDIFVKPRGRPMKIGYSGSDQPSHLTIDALNIRLGDNLIHISGSILHQPDHQAQLKITSEGFKYSELITVIPLLENFEKLDGPNFSATVRGSLDQAANRLMSGQLYSKSAKIMDADLTDFEIDFHQEGQRIKLPLIKGTLFDGKLSANGEATTGDRLQYNIEAVINDFDFEKMPRLAGLISGRGSLVFKLTNNGRPSVSGVMVAPRASVSTLPVGTNLLGPQTWKTIESQLEGTKLEVKGSDALTYLDPSVKDLHASFSLAKNIVTITDLRYLNPLYSLWLHGTIDPSSVIEATGSIWLNKNTTTKLIKDPVLQKKITNRDGELQIPFSLKGKSSALELKLAEEELKRIIEGNSASSPKTAEPKKKKPPPKKKKPRPRSRPRSRSIPPSQTDDIMKVIIR
jgi:hypothetical protein